MTVTPMPDPPKRHRASRGLLAAGRVNNAIRQAEAAARQCAAVRAAVDALGPNGTTARQREAAALRLAHPDASLAELGELCDPPVTKDAYASLLRRLVADGQRAAHRARFHHPTRSAT